MKIKTITCHDVYNTGAGLQAYALQKYLSDLGHDVEIIDYKPDYLSRHFKLWGVGNPAYDKPILREMYNLAKFPSRLKALKGRRKKRFDMYKKEFLHTTMKRYASNDELIRDLPEADIYICGSDQIWNPLFPNGRDPAFFLDFVPKNKVKASYAASFSVDSIPKNASENIKKWLSDYSYISVRENSGLRLLKDMGFSDSVVSLDPVFLLCDTQWFEITPKISCKDKYLLVYDFDGCSELRKAAEYIKEKYGWKIYSILPCVYADESYAYGGPLEFLSLVKNAEYILSNSFHATAFALIFKRQFLVFPRKEALNSRMLDLTSQFGLDDRMIEKFIPEVITHTIDFMSLDKKMEQEILNSKLYLDRILRKAEKLDRSCGS